MIKKIVMDSYLSKPTRNFSRNDVVDMQKHIVKLCKTPPDMLGRTHTSNEDGESGTVESNMINNQWMAAILMMGNVWRWETGTDAC